VHTPLIAAVGGFQIAGMIGCDAGFERVQMALFLAPVLREHVGLRAAEFALDVLVCHVPWVREDKPDIR
jgi:hypothetical protein